MRSYVLIAVGVCIVHVTCGSVLGEIQDLTIEQRWQLIQSLLSMTNGDSNEFMSHFTDLSGRVISDELSLKGIEQFYIEADKENWKPDTLIGLLNALKPNTRAVIYVNKDNKASWLEETLEEAGYTVSSMHGGMYQADRDYILEEFKSGYFQLLITTDLIAQSIKVDVQDVSLVINYDIPTKRENYIHRVGRLQSSGRQGVAITLITKEEIRMLNEIEGFYNTKIKETPIYIGALI